jgi:Uma2 family endonuclease
MRMPASTESPKRWTAQEARELTNEARHWPRYEVIDGELLVTPAPRLVHQRAVQRLGHRLHEYLGRGTVGEVFMSPADLELESDTTVQPDVFVVPPSAGQRPRQWSDVSRLLLAVEVVSPDSARHDRTTKRRFYQRVGVAEYWVADLDARLVERWRPGDERPQIDERRLEWRPEGASEVFVLDLEAFFSEACGEEPPGA